ncbi:MAG: DUF3164 family protein [Geobacteraceae bacterium]|nr:DUF3164 family protein [Geobacteraceae bacterium]
MLDGHMRDAQGRLVPLEMVKEIDLQRDQVVKEIIQGALEVTDMIAVFKFKAFNDIQAFVELSAERFDKSLGGTKGNVTLCSYDGKYKVVRAIDEYQTFDERLQVAKQLIDKCIHRWSEGSNANIQVLVQDAFQVDKKGQVNIKRILSLRRLEIQDEEWQKAMTAISESLQVAGTKEYLRIYEKEPTGEYKQISLDVAR